MRKRFRIVFGLLLLADSDVNVRTSAVYVLKIIDPEALAKAGVK